MSHGGASARKKGPRDVGINRTQIAHKLHTNYERIIVRKGGDAIKGARIKNRRGYRVGFIKESTWGRGGVDYITGARRRSREQPRPVSMGVGNLATMAGGTQVRSFFLVHVSYRASRNDLSHLKQTPM